MSARQSWSHLLLLSWLAVGCGSDPQPSHSVSTKSYSRTCASVADCFPVYDGPVGCCGAGCPNTAIRQDALAAYMSNFNAASLSACMGIQPPCAPPPACPDGRVACVAGLCQLETASAAPRPTSGHPALRRAPHADGAVD